MSSNVGISLFPGKANQKLLNYEGFINVREVVDFQMKRYISYEINQMVQGRNRCVVDDENHETGKSELSIC